jgi:diketogulonate reductase-like aldo/keto reductase
MPSVGLGTAGIKDKDTFVRAIMDSGYVHIDTATWYKNEEFIGEAIQEAYRQGKTREDLYIVTKLWQTDYHRNEKALRKGLAKL